MRSSRLASAREHRLVELLWRGKGEGVAETHSLDRSAALGCQNSYLLAASACGGALLSEPHDRVVDGRSQLS
jgi:hypothetical protein